MDTTQSTDKASFLKEYVDRAGVSLSDVARYLGVTNGAVSLQLSGKRPLRPETEEAIEALVAKRLSDQQAALTGAKVLLSLREACDPERAEVLLQAASLLLGVAKALTDKNTGAGNRTAEVDVRGLHLTRADMEGKEIGLIVTDATGHRGVFAVPVTESETGDE